MPIRVRANPEEARIENVVPRLVADSAAPAAKAWSDVVPGTMQIRRKEREIGRRMPVVATAVERGRLDSRGAREVDRPPTPNR